MAERFVRNPAARWHREVPGTRWFRADLHVHTLDDHPCNRMKMPAGLQGSPEDPTVLVQYARMVLRTAIERGVEVLGLTPHCARAGAGPETSAVWHIVEQWNSGNDDDGVPFRDKIYAVFPGFEPSVSDGARGIHLAFLFDPEIGRDIYLQLFNAVMGGITPWNGDQFRVTRHSAAEVFEVLSDCLKREGGALCSTDGWSCMALAPHAFADNGLFGGQKAQILEGFPSEMLSAIELGDNKLPEDEFAKKAWLEPAMEQYGHAFYHASDAYRLGTDVDEEAAIGHRVTLLKLASPRIEALRQAFLAAESRLRLVYERDATGNFSERGDLPSPNADDHRWLRSVTVTGGASFFGGNGGTEFSFSPDLTCIIGGSMTGKSTLLDGLRVRGDFSLPSPERIREDVTRRAHERFLSGDPAVESDIPGSDPTAEFADRWPARFYAQGELQSLANDHEGIRQILFHLVPEKTALLMQQNERLTDLDTLLSQRVPSLSKLMDKRDEMDQSFARVREAKEALDRLAGVGVEALQETQVDASRLAGAQESAQAVLTTTQEARDRATELTPPELKNVDLAAALSDPDEAESFEELQARAVEGLTQADTALQGLDQILTGARSQADGLLDGLRKSIQEALIQRGGQAEDLNQFAALSRAAANYESYRAALQEVTGRLTLEMREFESWARERAELVGRYREEMQIVLTSVSEHFGGQIRIRVEEEGVVESLYTFLSGFRQKGVTQWWNSLEKWGGEVGVAALCRALDEGELETVGMSAMVAKSFQELMAEKNRLHLRSLRCPDRYVIEWRVDLEGPKFRRLEQLSGGQRVSVLLSLLLEADDSKPLVIDQPEDELDNRYLYDTVLPALRRLKGRRQVVLVTHNANIVVNGDADHVIALEATAAQGRVAVQGAIEDEAVKEAIVRTLDGGRDAFKLRRTKYGF